jgi:ABC-type transport system involved in cytochrome bd biosynthesis fused ATPase/permease subunit
MKKQLQSATSLPLAPTDERRIRMIKYSIAMGIRMACIVAMLFVSGWWLVVCATGAIVLPYFAMIVANVKMAPKQGTVERPSTIVLYQEKSS